eukprot:GFYU01000361.1.p1 GENE.GFYU01000361.1~~GFYU01000361.1.p1  ORF type:complete len:137 (+),score=26.33 GFYU01000361.1:102-512(+)
MSLTEDEVQLIRRVFTKCMQKEHVAGWEAYMSHNAEAFAGDNGTEHKLEYTEIYNGFVKTVEDGIDGILAEEGFTAPDFFELIKMATEEEAANQAFVSILMSTMDYQTFADLMKSEKQRDYYFHIIKQWHSSLSQE